METLPRAYEVLVRDRIKFRVAVRREAIDRDDMHELVLDAWQMMVPKRVVREFLGDV